MSKITRKGSEAKFYPNTKPTLQAALLSAKRKNDTLGATTFLLPTTVARLTTVIPLYEQGMTDLGSKIVKVRGLVRKKMKRG